MLTKISKETNTGRLTQGTVLCVGKFSKLSRVSAQDTSVKYDYVDNRIKDITFGYKENVLYNEKYSFEYDEFGNKITQGTVLCVDKNKQNLLKYCRGESNAKASKNNE